MSTHKKYSPCFLTTQIDQLSPPVVRNAASTDRERHQKRLKIPSKLKRKLNWHKIFAMDKNV